MHDCAGSTPPIQIIPLGGTDRIGMNATLIGQGGRFVLIDLGATFVAADDAKAHQDGRIERIVPDLGRVAPWMQRVEALVVTHAHQDHIGAITTLIPDGRARMASVPIYATRYTAGMIERSYEDSIWKPELRTVRHDTPVAVGPFTIRWIPVTHSAPDTSLVVLETSHGAIIVGTDIKDDPDPIIGRATDFGRLAELGDRGVLAFLADSTNVHRTGWSRSEGDVLGGLTEIMARHPGRVVISTFSSNVGRVASAHAAAQATGRSLAMLGRSLMKSVGIAHETGHLDPAMKIHKLQDLNDCPDRHSALICTGSQAEENSALRSMVDRLAHGRPGLRSSDLFVHSARTIPGNEHSVNEMLEAMRRAGITVVTAEEGAVHASGHGHRKELTTFYEALRPRFAVPMHGTRPLIGEHIAFAGDLVGPGRAISPAEGEILELTDARAEITGRLPIGSLAKVQADGDSGRFNLIPWMQ